MSALQSQEAAVFQPYTDFLERLEFRRRVRELEELAAAEGLKLPMPARWIAVLEACGYVVDLTTGQWTEAAAVQYWPTEAALALALPAWQEVQP